MKHDSTHFLAGHSAEFPVRERFEMSFLTALLGRLKPLRALMIVVLLVMLGAQHSASAATPIIAWGSNSSGQLGNGSTTNSRFPVTVTKSGALSGKTVVQVNTSDSHGVALCSDGTVVAWGSNRVGQLGDGSTTDSSVPVVVVNTGALNGKTVTGVSAGNSFSLALCSDGTLVSWGWNPGGQLGDGSNINSSVPVAVVTSGALSGKTVTQISAGTSYSLALCDDGTVVAWGYNFSGQLGNGSTTNSNAPVAVVNSGILSSKTVTQISAGGSYSLARCSDGTLVTWGATSNVPVAFASNGALSGKSVMQVSAGVAHNLALCSDGTVVAWGSNNNGELGNNSSASSNIPVAVVTSGALSGKTVTQISAGSNHSVALCSDGTVVAWGSNSDNQLGGTAGSISRVPVDITSNGALGGVAVIQLSAGGSNNLALATVEPSAPIVVTSAPDPVTSTSATLKATINPGATATTAQFKFGTTTAYGQTLTITLAPTDGTSAQAVSANISGLTPFTTYHFRAVATNSLGTTNGADVTFTTFEVPSLVVTTTADTVAADNQTSLREAINFANSNFDASTISFAPSVTGTINLQSALPDLKFATVINGPGADTLTIARAAGTANFGLLTLDPDSPNFTRPPFNATISGLTFTGGNAAQGGALYVKKANLTITDCAFVGNTAFNGGAVAGALFSNFVVRNSTFSNNVSTHYGGGFYSVTAATLEQCTFDGNTATDNGGAIYCSGKPTLDSCTLTGNRVTAAAGAGTSIGRGGAIYVVNASAQPLLRNCIIAGNTRGAAGSVRDDVSGAIDDQSVNNLIGDGSGSTGVVNGGNGNQVGTINTAINPLLGALGDNGGPTPTRELLAGSPAVNKGNNAAASGLTSDQRGPGFPRKVGGTVDIGAFESTFANRPPLLNNATYSTTLNLAFSQQLAGSDPDGDALTYVRSGGTLPPGITLNANSGLMSGTPNTAGRYDFSVNVNDGKDTLTARFIIIVSSMTDAIGPNVSRPALNASYTRDQLAALVYEGTIADVAAGGATPTGVSRLLFQLRRESDKTAYSGTSDGFTTNVNRGYYAAILSDAVPNTTAGARPFKRTFSTFIPPASVLTPGTYSLVIAAQDVAGNWSIEVVPINIVTAPPVSRVKPATPSGSSALRSSKSASGGNG